MIEDGSNNCLFTTQNYFTTYSYLTVMFSALKNTFIGKEEELQNFAKCYKVFFF